MSIQPTSGHERAEAIRSRWNGSTWSGQALADLRFSVRSLCRARWFTLTVVLTLFLGIGVTTLVYDLTQWIVFRESPFPQSEKLFFIGAKDKKGDTQYVRAGFYLQAYKDQTKVFSEFAALEHTLTNVVLAGQPIAEQVANVFEGSFATLGIQPVLGRGFLPAEFKPGDNKVVVIKDALWRKYFNADPDVLGRRILLNQDECTIVGVLGRDQQMPANFEAGIYRPLVYQLSNRPEQVFAPALVVIGRLQPGITPPTALAAISTVKLPPVPQWAAAYFADQATLLTNITGMNRPDVCWVMVAAAVLLYAIACLNATNLMLIRLLGRRRELSIRFAVGGSRRQVTQLVAIEGLLLALAACLMVTLFVRWGFPPIFRLLNGTDVNDIRDYGDWRTLACVCGLSVLACLFATAAPASRILRADISSGLKEGGPSLGEGRTTARIRNAFVVLQAAFAVVLLTGTGLMVRSFEQLSKVDLGFDPIGKVKVFVLPASSYPLKPDARLELFDRLQRKLSLLPGVKAAAYGEDSLLVGHFWGTAQLKMADGTYQATAGNYVSGDFQQTAGLTMREGRWLSGKRGNLEVVINETMAKERFAGRDPIGQFIQLQVSGPAKFPVVGVVKDVRDNMRTSSGMRFYIGAWAYPLNVDTIVLRLDRDPGKEFAGLVRRAVFEVDPNLVTADVSSMSQAVTDSMAVEHYAYNILRAMATIALALTVIGIFSVITFTVESRMSEFGVRVALGASPSNLTGLVLRRGVAGAATGIGIGIVGALGLTRFMESMLYHTSPFDPIVYPAVAFLLLAAAIAACWLPARRAALVDVMQLLKSE